MQFLNSIALLRAIAVSIVVYAHLVGQFTIKNNIQWWPQQFLNTYFFEPFGIFQQGGQLGVAIFFLVSGYIIPYVAVNDSKWPFLVKRFFRIYPPFIISIFFAVVVYCAAHYFGFPKKLHNPETISNVLLNMSLLNFYTGTKSLNGVAWTLVIEVVFYLWIAALLKVLYRKPNIAIFLTLYATFFLLNSTTIIRLQGVLAPMSVFICYMFMGTVIYLRHFGFINKAQLFIGTICLWLLFMKGIDMRIAGIENPTNGFVISYLWAYIIFVTTIFLEPFIKLPTAIQYISDKSYSIYLYHGLIRGAFFSYLVIGYPISLLMSIIVILIFCHFAHKYIEQPSQLLAKSLIDKRYSIPCRVSPQRVP